MRTGLGLLTASLLSVAAVSASPNDGIAKTASESRPDFIVLICDDLNAPAEADGGYDTAPTPNLDRLASSGVSFTNAHANAPLCAPSRPSLLTGLHPVTTAYYGGTANAQVRHWRANPRLRRAATLMEHFRNHGYFVLGTGKVFHNYHEDPFVWQDENGYSQFGYLPSWGPFPWDGVVRNYTRPPDVPPHPSTPFIRGMMGYAPLSDVPDVPAAEDGSSPGYEGWRLYNRAFHYAGPEDRDLMPDELNARWAVERLESDHGYHLGSKRFVGKFTLWEESTRVRCSSPVPAWRPDERWTFRCR